jgi:hypothetical protein
VPLDWSHASCSYRSVPLSTKYAVVQVQRATYATSRAPSQGPAAGGVAALLPPASRAATHTEACHASGLAVKRIALEGPPAAPAAVGGP